MARVRRNLKVFNLGGRIPLVYSLTFHGVLLTFSNTRSIGCQVAHFRQKSLALSFNELHLILVPILNARQKANRADETTTTGAGNNRY